MLFLGSAWIKILWRRLVLLLMSMMPSHMSSTAAWSEGECRRLLVVLGVWSLMESEPDHSAGLDHRRAGPSRPNAHAGHYRCGDEPMRCSAT